MPAIVRKRSKAIDAALAIDPDFLAAHSLRDRILASCKPAAPEPPSTLERQVQAR
jgi:hypothetical protein